MRDFYKHTDPDGRVYRLSDMTGPGGAAKGNPVYEVMGVTRAWRYSRDSMEKLIAAGRVYQSTPGNVPQQKRYLMDMPGVALQNDWDDLQPVMGGERRGYPTQKPLALLERIIAASCPEGGVVMDPFCGCGTAVVAAERMGRNWIGIDVTYLAINEITDRLATETKAKRLDKLTAKTPHPDARYFTILGTPKDEASAVALFEDPTDPTHKKFEMWAVTLVGAKYSPKKVADGGVDGETFVRDLSGKRQPIVVQVKGGQGLTLSQVRDFGRVIKREKAVVGILVCQREPTKDMLAEAEGLGVTKWANGVAYPRYQILTTRAILEGGHLPHVPSSVAYLAEGDVQKGVGQVTAAQGSLLD